MDPKIKVVTSVTCHRIAHKLAGKLKGAGVVFDEAAFLKEACDADVGDY